MPETGEFAKKALEAFMGITWESPQGLTEFLGDPGSGELKVRPISSSWSTDTADAMTSADQTVFMVDRSIYLRGRGTHQDLLKMLPAESQLHKQITWDNLNQPQLRETWFALDEKKAEAIHKPRQCTDAEDAFNRWEHSQVRGRRAARRKDHREAVDHFHAASQAAPRTSSPKRCQQESIRSMVDALVECGLPEAAKEQAAWLLQVDNREYANHHCMAMALVAMDDYAGARESYHEAAMYAPTDITRRNMERGALEMESELLLQGKFPQLRQTYRATDMAIEEVMDFYERAIANPQKVTERFGTVPRNFALIHKSKRKTHAELPFILTMPALDEAKVEHRQAAKYPLLLYLHSAASTDICKGDVLNRQLQFVAGEAPQSIFVEQGRSNAVDQFIGIAPCCPPNLAALEVDMPKAYRRNKVYWFKACETFAYSSWDFSKAHRVVEVELLVVELLEKALSLLPIDPSRIYFVGSSCGGYAAFRLGEIVPRLPAGIVSLAGYYPEMPGEDHDVGNLVARIESVPLVWPLHCDKDKLCRMDHEHVAKLYEYLLMRRGVEVDPVPPSVAQGSQKNYHSSHNFMLTSPDKFFNRLLQTKRPDVVPKDYLKTRIEELNMELIERQQGRSPYSNRF